MNDTLGIYVHWPFCVSKCPYCGFVSFPVGSLPGSEMCTKTANVGAKKAADLTDLYLAALLKEIIARAPAFSDKHVDTVYLGGGTPSLAGPVVISKILDALRSSFHLQGDAQITIEANPDSVRADDLSAYLDSGVNRISIGVQSLNDAELKIIGRAHTADQAREALASATKAGFKDVGADLIFGVAGQTPGTVADQLKELVQRGVTHISTYGLSLDPGSRFAAESRNEVTSSEDETADIYETIAEHLNNSGFEHYEVSNFSHAGSRSRHNEKYWRRDPYLGFGLNASSFCDGYRLRNTADLSAYISSASADGFPEQAEVQRLTNRQAFEEELFLGLRLCDGISRDVLQHPSYGQALGEELARPVYKDLIEIDRKITLTTKGFLLSNEIFARLMLALDRCHEAGV